MYGRTLPSINLTWERQALFAVKHVTECLGFDEEFVRTLREYYGKPRQPDVKRW